MFGCPVGRVGRGGSGSGVARRLGVPTAELVQLVHDHKIEYVMADGIARIASDVLERSRLDRRRAS